MIKTRTYRTTVASTYGCHVRQSLGVNALGVRIEQVTLWTELELAPTDTGRTWPAVAVRAAERVTA